MPSKRRQSAKAAAAPTKGVLKASQRFIYAKTGKLSRTNVHRLFSDPELWNALRKPQQENHLTSLLVTRFFGQGHPEQLQSGKYTNYFTTPNPIATRVSPNPSTGREEVESANEVYFDLTKHLENFREHLTDGRFDPKWMKVAQEVSLQRARGDYDRFWQFDPETSLDEKGRRRVDAVKAKRQERIQKGFE
jgi:hypothetical protein